MKKNVGTSAKLKKNYGPVFFEFTYLKYAPTLLNRKHVSQPEDFQKRYNASFSLKAAQLPAVKNGGPKKYLYVFLSKKDA